MRNLWLLWAAGLLVVPGFAGDAKAQLYLGGHGGLSLQSDSDLGVDGGPDAEASFSEGYTIGGALGYRFGLQKNLSLDVEGEVTYRENDFDEIDLLGTSLDAGGDVSSLAFMGNIWLNLALGDSGFVPYVGGGIGATRIETNDVSVTGFTLSDESDTVGAGQLGAGIGYRITENVSVSFDYRFLMSEEPEFDDVEAENENHSLRLGLRYLF